MGEAGPRESAGLPLPSAQSGVAAPLQNHGNQAPCIRSGNPVIWQAAGAFQVCGWPQAVATHGTTRVRTSEWAARAWEFCPKVFTLDEHRKFGREKRTNWVHTSATAPKAAQISMESAFRAPALSSKAFVIAVEMSGRQSRTKPYSLGSMNAMNFRRTMRRKTFVEGSSGPACQVSPQPWLGWRAVVNYEGEDLG